MTTIADIAAALVAAGFTSLDDQARVLNVHRSTAWTIMTSKHKLDRLQVRTVERMLASPTLPPSVRGLVYQYATVRCMTRRIERRRIGKH